MKYSETLERNLRLWPDTVDVSDGELTHMDGGLFPQLSAAWGAVREITDEEGEVAGVMTWALYTALHKLDSKSEIVTDT